MPVPAPVPVPGVVLLVDDDVTAKRVEAAVLAAVPSAAVTRARSRDEFVEALRAGVALVVSDGAIAGCEGLQALHMARRGDPSSCFVLLPGQDAGQLDDAGLLALGVVRVPPDRLDDAGRVATDALLDRLAEHHSDRAARYEQLVTTVMELSLAGDIAAVMRIVRTAARRLTGADGATFVLRDNDMCYYADEDAIGPLWKGSRFPIEQCISGWAMINRHPAVIGDIYADPRIPLSAYEPTFVRSLVMVPIRALDPIGAIGTYWAHTRQSTPADVRMLQALADTTAVAIENARVHQDLERRVRERTEDLEAFTYAVSHDLRAPIRHIASYAALLQEQVTAGDGAGHTLSRLSGSVESMRDMVNGLLEMARTARSEPRRVRLDLAGVAREVAEECRLGSSHPVEFVAPAEAWVDADPVLLRTVLQNLIGNAWKFTSRTETARVEFAVEADGAGVPVYVVQDNGAGFDPAHADRLFGVFQRLHTQEAFPGTGVGLASVRRIVQRHGGTISATGAPREGARFSFTLASSSPLGS
jgi:signal transduction histidine kinase